MTFTIRPADISDIESVSQLFDGYRVYYKQLSDIALAKGFISDRLTQGDSAIFVAEDLNSNLLGFVQLYPIFSSVNASRSLLLNDLYVAEPARRSGVARQLMVFAQNYAKQQNACWLMLQTEKTNLKAQALYENLGYKQDKECSYYYLSLR